MTNGETLSAPFPAGSVPAAGVLTLVFTDIEGSSELSRKHGAAFEGPRAEHYRLLRAPLAEAQGQEVHTAGDSLFAVFPRATDAVRWAVAVQRALLTYPWPEEIGPVRVRIGMCTGEPILVLDNGRPDYYGNTPNRAARVAAAAHGGQILLAEATHALVATEMETDNLRFRDLGVHRLKGVGEERLWQVLAPDLPSEFPTPATLGAVHHNLPLPPTAFLGRDADVAALHNLLTGGAAHLVTLTGFGGMGKTRTALQVAESCAESFAGGGVWWCDLAEARTADAMLQKIAFDLGLELQPPPSARERVQGWLRERGHCLLILDNLEQVGGAENIVRDLLAAAPGAVFLVTSRRTLGLRAESAYELQPMPTTDAIRLFTERARAVRGDFAITAENESDVAELCRHLEGVPLALELAAARVAALTPRQILARLGERFRLLQTRTPDLPERQRALRAAIDWSYELLDADLRRVFAQLSVFARSGFTLEDAEAVCEGFDVMESVFTLRGNSLLAAETDETIQVVRYHLLESLREYAAERLHEEPSEFAHIVKERHARHFLRHAELGIGCLRTPGEAEALTRLEAVIDDLRGAAEWAGSPEGDADLHARLGLALGTLLSQRGFPGEALRWVEMARASGQTVPALDADIRLGLLCESAGLHLDLRLPELARERAEEARQIAEQVGNASRTADAENLLGQAALAISDFAGARLRFRSALERRMQTHARPTEIALLQNNLGLTEYQDPEGDATAGVALLQEALRVRQASGDQRGVAATLNNLGNFAYKAADWDEAARCYAEALAYERALHHAFGVALALNNYGETREQAGEVETALRCYAAAAHLFQEGGSPYADYAAERLTQLADQRNLSEAERDALRAAPGGRNLEAVCAWALAATG